jgi:hypothetical protein
MISGNRWSAALRRSEQVGTALWVALIAGASIVFSLALACATPFPALATIAGARMRLPGAAALVGAAWIANQAVGYLVLGYPRTWDSFAWGGVIGIVGLMAIVPAAILVGRTSIGATIIAGFVLAFFLYELGLFAATAFLPSGPGAFAPSVVWRIFWINALALVLLLALHRVALTLGFLPRPSLSRRVLAGLKP